MSETPINPGDDREAEATTNDESDEIATAAAAARRSLEELMHDPEITAELSDNSDVWKDLGGGDRIEQRLFSLKQNIARGFMSIDEYQPFYRGDRNAYMLHQALMAVFSVSETKGHDIERMVAERSKEYALLGGEIGKRNASARLYDSIGALKNAFNFVLNPEDISGDKPQLVEQFTKDILPSPIWEDEDIKDPLFKAIDSAYRLIGIMSADNKDSIDRFLLKLQREIVTQGLGFTVKTKRENGYGNYRRHLDNARNLAWKEWDHEAAGIS